MNNQNNSYSAIFRTVFGTDVGTSVPEFTLVYVSAHWCTPCRRFTPLLRDFYNLWQEETKENIEVIFVSSDRDQNQFDEYSATMPWQALPFQERKLVDQFKREYNVGSIPSLLVFDRNGRLISRKGRFEVRDKGSNVISHWRQLARQ